ncbi:MAG: hypothetical protein LBB72_02755 [Spirochaetaceae bacterium]|nr:hypothetical protein [Spirochaetaceae bacterium]
MAFAIDIGPYGDLDTILEDHKKGNPLEQGLLDELTAMWKRGELHEDDKNKILSEIRPEIRNYLEGKYIGAYSNPKELFRGFANASVFASHSATQRGYANYKNFAFTIGAMAGIRLPGGILHPVNDIMAVGNRILDDPDIRLGANIQAVNSQLGINMSSLLDGLYMGIRFTFGMLYNYQDLSLKTNSLGVSAHYQLIKGMDGGNGWDRGFKWRGITVGTGLLYSNTVLSGTFELDDYSLYGFSAQETELNFNIDVTTFTIPLEIYTSAFFLWFINVQFGLGVDVAFGKNISTLGVNTMIRYEDTEVGPIQAEGSGTMSPSLINPKIVMGIGFKFGPVILDIPVNYYLFKQGSGLSLGVTLGVCY